MPITFSTDGEWIWSGATAYYLEQYALAPDPEFYEHVRSQDYICRDVAEDVVRDASAQIHDAPPELTPSIVGDHPGQQAVPPVGTPHTTCVPAGAGSQGAKRS